MKSRLSAFMDGELPAAELDELLLEIASRDAAGSWRYYELARAVVSDEKAGLTRSGSYSADLTRSIMQQLTAEEPTASGASGPRSADVIPFPAQIRRWGLPAALAASAAAAAVFLGAFEPVGPQSVAQNSAPAAQMKMASAPAPRPSVSVSHESAPTGLAMNDEALVRSREPVENQVIPELNEFILQHNSIASSRHFQPTLSYARVVSHGKR